jgi:hypothetical protein
VGSGFQPAMVGPLHSLRVAAALIDELVEAAHANQLSRALDRRDRLDLICIDELGYVPLAETACEFVPGDRRPGEEGGGDRDHQPGKTK